MNVFVDKNKLDILANSISAKSGESLTLTLDEMVEAVDGIESGGGGITPTGNIDITQAGVTDVTNYATATVPSAEFFTGIDYGYYTENNVRKWHFRGKTDLDTGEGDTEGWLADGTYYGTYVVRNVVPSGTTITPTTSSQTIGGTNYMMEGAVTVSAMPTGTAGTPTATKGAVSNHSVSVTPSVTNTTGYITGSTKTGTAVTVSASELVSGDKSITENGNNIDVANYSTVSVNVSGGGGSSVQIGYADVIDIPSATSSISFTGLSGEPTSFLVYYGADLSTPSGTPYKVACLVYDGTDIHGQTITNTSNAQVTYDGSNFSKSYNNGTLTLSSSGAYFQAGDYYSIYSYNGTAGNIKTADVQVGSGATSITFTDLEAEPIAWYCIFKSNFGTSNGYQRVIFVTDIDGDVGMAMDSSAHLGAYWTSSYNNGSFTITSYGTNNGGYFHQPGYYQLTYVVDASGNYQTKTKTYTPTTSQQTETITADNGYDALKKVDVTVNAMPTMTLPSATSVTSSGTSKATITPSSSVQYLNIPTGYNGTSQYYTISASGGGTSKNVQVVQGTTRTTSSTLTAIGAELTVSKTGTYDVYWSAFRSNTSSQYTFATKLYINGTGYGSEQTTWSNHVQNNHLTNVSLTANQKLMVYGRNSRGSSYYIYAPTLVIIEV